MPFYRPMTTKPAIGVPGFDQHRTMFTTSGSHDWYDETVGRSYRKHHCPRALMTRKAQFCWLDDSRDKLDAENRVMGGHKRCTFPAACRHRCSLQRARPGRRISKPVESEIAEINGSWNTRRTPSLYNRSIDFREPDNRNLISGYYRVIAV